MKENPLPSGIPNHPIELLAPARDLACGLAAINHGADAVYIGAPRFGARSAAGNSLADIAQLIDYAHRFAAKVYIALNTLLSEAEIEEAVRLGRELWNIGADALIIQDLGLLECDLPPIPLHASTQTDNRSVAKAVFLEQVGFQQIVLARELDLEQIAAIRAATSLPLEFFIHGALCVSYSGRCLVSEVMAGRSANRGECAQFCRHRFSLRDGRGQTLVKDRYLLSLQDLDLSDHIAALLKAGISSLKIEGRLKDESYVKNVTAHYRLILDRLLAADPGLRPASAGRCRFGFQPDPSKTFQRGGTDYFLNQRRNRPGSVDTPKSLGREIGRVTALAANGLVVEGGEVLANGDGLCYFDDQQILVGLKVNRVEGRTIYPREKTRIRVGTILYRNADTAFLGELKKSESCRLLPVEVVVGETDQGLFCRISDVDGCRAEVTLEVAREVAKQPGTIAALIERQIRKSGGTLLLPEEVRVEVDPSRYFAAATINDLRRQAFAAYLEERVRSYRRQELERTANSFPWPEGEADCVPAISNPLAEAFYRRHGAGSPARLAEAGAGPESPVLMTCRYCLKAQLDLCPQLRRQKVELAEPLVLVDNTGEYELRFNCRRCEMEVLLLGKKSGSKAEATQGTGPQQKKKGGG